MQSNRSKMTLPSDEIITRILQAPWSVKQALAFLVYKSTILSYFFVCGTKKLSNSDFRYPITSSLFSVEKTSQPNNTPSQHCCIRTMNTFITYFNGLTFYYVASRIVLYGNHTQPRIIHTDIAEITSTPESILLKCSVICV